MQGPEKIKVLVWLEAHRSTPTLQVLHHRHIVTSNICARCKLTEEDLLHCTRDCAVPRFLWTSLGFSGSIFFLNQDSLSWLRDGISGQDPTLFLAGLWCAWTARNRACVANEDVDQYRVVREAKSLAITIHHCFYSGTRIPKEQRWVSWNPSRDATYILNVDGCRYAETRRSGAGGRTAKDWVAGFVGFLGDMSVLQAELVAMSYGLDLAWDRGLRWPSSF